MRHSTVLPKPPAGQPLPEAHTWMTLRTLLPYLWRYRLRVVAALSCLIGAKIANVSVPLIFKEMIDGLSVQQQTLALPALLLWPAWHLKHPLLFAFRHVETPLLLALAMAGLVWRGGFPGRLLVVLLLAVIVVTLFREGEYQMQRAAVLSGGASMQAVGGHFIVGYTDFNEVKTLAARGLIGGIYLAKRNLRGRTLAEVAGDIAALNNSFGFGGHDVAVVFKSA